MWTGSTYILRRHHLYSTARIWDDIWTIIGCSMISLTAQWTPLYLVWPLFTKVWAWTFVVKDSSSSILLFWRSHSWVTVRGIWIALVCPILMFGFPLIEYAEACQLSETKFFGFLLEESTPFLQISSSILNLCIFKTLENSVAVQAQDSFDDSWLCMVAAVVTLCTGRLLINAWHSSKL